MSNILLGFAQIASDVYGKDAPSGDLNGWRRSNTQPYLYTAGNFLARVYEHTKTKSYAVVFRGTDLNDGFWIGANDVKSDLQGVGLGSFSALNLTAALSFAGHWTKRSKHVWVVGHSLGGGYAQLVAAKLNSFGITFNAPGVLHLVNQLSAHPLEKAVGLVSSPVLQVMLRGLGSVDLISFFDKAASADDDSAFAPVANYRSQGDIVSLCGVHIGAPEKIIQVSGGSDPLNQHRMERIVEALGGSSYTPTTSTTKT